MTGNAVPHQDTIMAMTRAMFTRTRRTFKASVDHLANEFGLREQLRVASTKS